MDFTPSKLETGHDPVFLFLGGQMAYFKGNFSCEKDVLQEFGLQKKDLNGMEILYAEYETADYEGSAFILLRDQAGNYFEVNSSHCSCNGLEWCCPEPTTKKALLARPNVVPHVKELLKLSLLA